MTTHLSDESTKENGAIWSQNMGTMAKGIECSTAVATAARPIDAPQHGTQKR